MHLYGSELQETGPGIAPTREGGWFLVGTYRFAGGADSTKALVVKIDSEGEEEWTRIYREYPSGDGLYDAVSTPDGGFAACGKTGTEDYLLMRFDSLGNVLWRQVWDIRGINYCYDIIALEDGGYFLTGAASNDAWVIRTEPDPANQNSIVLPDPAFYPYSLSPPFPSPFNSSLTIPYSLPRSGVVRLALFDLAGREVAVLQQGRAQQAGPYAVRWNATGFPAGEYIIRLECGEEAFTGKAVLVK